MSVSFFSSLRTVLVLFATFHHLLSFAVLTCVRMVNLNVIYLPTCIYRYRKIVAPRAKKKCVIIAKLHIVFSAVTLRSLTLKKENWSTMSMHRKPLIFRWLLLVVAVDNVYLSLIALVAV